MDGLTTVLLRRSTLKGNDWTSKSFKLIHFGRTSLRIYENQLMIDNITEISNWTHATLSHIRFGAALLLVDEPGELESTQA
jgi:hypothetical protein